MLLYRDVERVYNELSAAGLRDDDELAAADLAAFDQYHYHGTDAIDVAIEVLGINSDSRVLEIGSGIGGPARHIAAMTGANWLTFTKDRHADFRRNRPRHEEVHGVEIVDGLERFYGTVAALFSGGNLGGIRICARLTR